MEIGLVFPTTEIMDHPERIREYARRADQHGFDHLLIYEHVLGTDPDKPGWEGPFDVNDPFHEPFVLFSHLAAVTDDIEFITGILILPQRQTALVAKQAAQLDVLSEGRFRMGVGLGWNEPEYEALGHAFDNRGKRIEEQIDVLKSLWSQKIVNYEGRWHAINRMGINPRPTNERISIWMGGTADPVLDRVARLADGWLPQFDPGDKAHEQLDRLHEYCGKHDRSINDVGIHGRTKYHGDGSLEEAIQAWRELGADFLSINPMYGNLSPGEHLDLLDDLRDTVEKVT